MNIKHLLVQHNSNSLFDVIMVLNRNRADEETYIHIHLHVN